MAGGEGFEPPLAESESAVLPLDEPPAGRLNLHRNGSVPRRPHVCIPRHKAAQKRSFRRLALLPDLWPRWLLAARFMLRDADPLPRQSRHAKHVHAARCGLGEGVVVAAIANDYLHGF